MAHGKENVQITSLTMFLLIHITVEMNMNQTVPLQQATIQLLMYQIFYLQCRKPFL